MNFKLLIGLCLCLSCGLDFGAEEVEPHSKPIIGGTFVPDGAYPFMAALYEDGEHFCGGSLLGTDWVLTAAHCVVDGSDVAVDPSTLSVRLGVNDLDSGQGISVGVSQVIVHPGWDSSTSNNDIALLRLSTQVTGANIDSINIIDQSDPQGIGAVGVVATAAGWGNSGTQETPVYDPNMLHVDLEILSNNVVNRSQYLDGQVSALMLAAGSLSGGIDTCQGDSGGPLFVNRYGQFHQIGITSWGIGCAEPGHPGIYARMSRYHDWIESHTGDLGDYPDLDINVPSLPSGATETITLQFSEDVSGLVIGNLSVSDGSLSNLQTINASTYTVDYTAAASEGAETITFTPGTVVDVDDARRVHFHVAEILIDNEINNVTSGTGVVAIGLSIEDSGPYSADQLGLDGLTMKTYDPSTNSYRTVTEVNGMQGIWIDAASAPSIQSPAGLTDVDTAIPLENGWNFFSIPYHDSVNWSVTTIQVRLPDTSVVTLQEARAQGYIEDYAWWYNSDTSNLVPVNDPAVVTMPGSQSTIDPWKPYWIRSYSNDIDLILPAVAQPYPIYSYAVLAPGDFKKKGAIHE